MRTGLLIEGCYLRVVFRHLSLSKHHIGAELVGLLVNLASLHCNGSYARNVDVLLVFAEQGSREGVYHLRGFGVLEALPRRALLLLGCLVLSHLSSAIWWDIGI